MRLRRPRYVTKGERSRGILDGSKRSLLLLICLVVIFFTYDAYSGYQCLALVRYEISDLSSCRKIVVQSCSVIIACCVCHLPLHVEGLFWLMICVVRSVSSWSDRATRISHS